MASRRTSPLPSTQNVNQIGEPSLFPKLAISVVWTPSSTACPTTCALVSGSKKSQTKDGTRLAERSDSMCQGSPGASRVYWVDPIRIVWLVPDTVHVVLSGATDA